MNHRWSERSLTAHRDDEIHRRCGSHHHFANHRMTVIDLNRLTSLLRGRFDDRCADRVAQMIFGTRPGLGLEKTLAQATAALVPRWVTAATVLA